MSKNVLVVIGIGGIGQAIARRQGAGKTVLLADFDERTLDAAAKSLEATGYAVSAMPVDVASRTSIHEVVKEASRLGAVTEVVHTAGVSPNMAPPDRILAVDLLGTALVLEEFGNIVAPGGAGIIISSMAGYMLPPLPTEVDLALATTPADELLKLPSLQPSAISDSGAAYAISKRANHLRIQAESLRWAERGARLNAISPGIILTPLAQKELSSPIGAAYRAMIAASALKRVGTPEEVASAAAFLLGPDAGFVTGSDLLMDGGVIPAIRMGRLNVEIKA
ncbi:SDR family oxidoreductase [Corallococcus exiguus]|uniref:SDR family oxidoreductase n=1 Tax=Corallococcus TaxID=83461 RepID=UPI000ED5F162|nr:MULTISPECIES: SDR family oxidoreductase [Corallococcus]NNB92558.1 SDR family oxidoreductase [Corallococcus exiguus]NPC46043.1 SDR family oxidoreductase [Corallococcus exiguus]RKH82842.1 SDR family oxidoreductase [Corallococcus sp. AB032C]